MGSKVKIAKTRTNNSFCLNGGNGRNGASMGGNGGPGGLGGQGGVEVVMEDTTDLQE